MTDSAAAAEFYFGGFSTGAGQVVDLPAIDHTDRDLRLIQRMNQQTLVPLGSVPLVLCSVGFLAVAFVFWGVNTGAGRRQFDEMAGVIPLAIVVGGSLAIAVGFVWFLVRLYS